jgi:FixJ family two-component response regulator
MAAVYIVDDNLPTSNALAFVFRTLDHEVRCYQSGVHMLTELLRHTIDPPALFIIDDDMPALEGMDLLRLLKANEATAGIPTIMFTARQEPEIRREALALGAADFWVKGNVSFEDICNRASRYLNQPLHIPSASAQSHVSAK